jgi:ferredoxin-NADP reductase
MTSIMFTVRLERIRVLSDSTKDFRFVRTDGNSMEYQPGQFFRFVFQDAKGEFERSYSLCNFDVLYEDHLDLVISRVEDGRATQLLFNCRQGLEASVTGPFGRLVLPAQLPQKAPSRLVMVATSVGLAPFMPILKQLESTGYRQVLLILGVRDRSEFIYSQELLEYFHRHENMELTLCLSRESANESYERDGYVTAEIQRLTVDPIGDHFLLCGNPRMVDDVWKHLKDQGCSSKQVVREKYVFAKEKKSPASDLSDEQKRLIAEKMKKYS